MEFPHCETDGFLFHPGACGRKLPHFIKLSMIGQAGFRHKSQNISLRKNRRAVIEFLLMAHRKAQHNNRIPRLCKAADFLQRLSGFLQQQFIIKKIAAGIAGDA